MSKIEEYTRRYHAALHGMQTGVAYRMQYEASESDPKHLRVGVNSAMVSQDALVRLLFEKGVIHEEEFYRHLAEAAEREVKMYEGILSKLMGGADIHLL